MVKPFIMDGIEYNVNVLSLERSFTVMDSGKSGRTQNGEMYRDPIGTYYNYTMTIAERNGDYEALDELWEAVSQPIVSHDCVFPYNQDTLTQKMYVTSGSQEIKRIYPNSTEWGEISLNFVAMSPKVIP